MLLELEDAHNEALNKLLAYAKQNDLKLSLVEDDEMNYTLPGKPLSENELKDLIAKSRKSGIVSMKDAHAIINNNYNAD